MSVNEGPSSLAVSTEHYTVRHQVYATIAANLIALSHGCIIGWVSPALPILASPDNTPLSSGPLTSSEMSWVGSINCIGAIFGSLSFGHFTAIIGSKNSVLFLAVPVILFWLFIYFGNAYIYILIARFIGGCTGGGVQSSIALYVAEICNDEIRGQLASVTLFARNIGTLIAFILGASVDYESICICIVIPFIFGIIFVFLPSTPRHYLQKNQIQKAEHALKYYKGYSDKNATDDNAINKEFERLKAITNEQRNEEKLNVSDFFTRSAIKGLAIGMALMVFQQTTASFAIVNYSVMTFTKIGASIDPHLSSITLAVALILGSFTTTYLADKIGRRALNLVSLLGSACGLMTTALYYYLSISGYDLTSFAFIPVASLCFVIFVSAAGISPLSIICSVENLPSKIRTYGMAIICCSLSIDAFVSVKYYPILLEAIDLHGCLMVYGVGSIIGSFFVLFVLSETSGQCLDDVGKDSIAKTDEEFTHFARGIQQKSYNTTTTTTAYPND